MISGHGTIETAVKAVRMGALDFVEKPLSLEKTLLVVRNALRRGGSRPRTARSSRQVDERYVMVGESPAMQRLRAEIAQAAPTNGRVLIFGENGTGKELVAREIHAESLRAAGPFVEVNCAAIPEELIESELFGHEKGAFTGALARAARASSSWPTAARSSSTRSPTCPSRRRRRCCACSQELRIEPVGGAGVVEVDVRVIAATNKDLEEEIRAGRFREDLYFRLNVVPIHVPPLRERREDVPLLARHFMQALSAEHGRRPREIAPEVLERLSRLPWPGNVRELRNTIERLVIMAPGERIEVRHLPPSLGEGTGAAPGADDSAEGVALAADGPLAAAREEFEKRYILRRYRESGGNMSRTADALGVERSNLYRKMKAYGLLPRREEA